MITFDDYQAKAPQPTIFLTEEDFEDHGDTRVHWLGSAGVFINTHGTTLMIDPVLGYMDSQPPISEAYEILLVKPPIRPEEVPHLDAVLYTHTDWDHFTNHTAVTLQPKTDTYHGTPFLNQILRYYGIHERQRRAHQIGESFQIGAARITLTLADHVYQYLLPERYDWTFKKEDCCGYLVETVDGTIWVPGDTRLLPEHLEMQQVDLLFMDYSDHKTHFGREGSLQLSNALRQAQIVMYHYGTYYRPDVTYFSADPEEVIPYIEGKDRFHLVAPGEAIVLHGSHRLT